MTTNSTKTKTKQDVTGINVLIPSSLHRRLRVKALNEGMTMSEAIERAVKTWLR